MNNNNKKRFHAVTKKHPSSCKYLRVRKCTRISYNHFVKKYLDPELRLQNVFKGRNSQNTKFKCVMSPCPFVNILGDNENIAYRNSFIY